MACEYFIYKYQNTKRGIKQNTFKNITKYAWYNIYNIIKNFKRIFDIVISMPKKTVKARNNKIIFS